MARHTSPAMRVARSAFIVMAALALIAGTVFAREGESQRDLCQDLVQSAKKGSVAETRKALDAGASVSCADKEYGGAPLHWAAYGGHRRVVNLLLKHKADVNALNKDHRTPLMMAAFNGHRALAKRLIEAGADVRARDNDGTTALIFAAANGRRRVVKLLLDSGADPSAKSKDGKVAQEWAKANGHKRVVRTIETFKHRKDSKAKRFVKRAKPFLEARVEAKKKPETKKVEAPAKKETVKPVAADSAKPSPVAVGKPQSVDTAPGVKQKEPSPQTASKPMPTPPAEAEKVSKKKETTEASGGKLDAVPAKVTEKTPKAALEDPGKDLIRAAFQGDKEEVARLLSKGANINTADKYLKTALMRASERGHVDIVELLLAKGADTGLRSKSGETALIVAARVGKAEVVKALLEKGADANTKRLDGKNALMALADSSSPSLEVAEILIKRGVDLGAKDSTGLTALKLAKRRNRSELIALLTKHTPGSSKSQTADKAGKSGKPEDKNAATKPAPKKPKASSAEKVRKPSRSKAAERPVSAGKRRPPGVRPPADKSSKHKQAAPSKKTAKFKAGNTNGNKANDELLKELSFNNLSEVKRLLAAGADPNAKDKEGQTAIMRAVGVTLAANDSSCSWGGTGVPDPKRLELVKLLIERGADVNAKAAGNCTALMSAVLSHQPEMVTLILDKGAEIDARNLFGDTALTLASKWTKNPQIVRLLLEKGANPNSKDRSGANSLAKAKSRFDSKDEEKKVKKEIIEILKAAGAKDNKKG